MRLKWLSMGLAAVVLCAPAVAQDVVGSSIVNGRQVQLMSNFSWKYITATPANCQTIQDNISFCGQNAGWTQISNGTDAAATFRLNDHSYGLFIVEALGSEEGMNEDGLRQMVIENAASAAKIQPKDIIALGTEHSMVDGIPGFTMTYMTKIDGLSVVFTNTMLIDKHRTVQVATWGIGQAFTGEMKANHTAFLDATHLK